MVDDRGVVRSISWRDLFPWLLLARVFRLSISIQLLFFATVGVLLQPVGWRVSDSLFLNESDRQGAGVFSTLVEQNRAWPGEWSHMPHADLPLRMPQVLQPFDGLTHAFHRLSMPARFLFDPKINVHEFAYLAVGNLWMLLVWSFFGAVISRVAVVHLAREERVSTKRAVMHAIRKLPAYFAAPLAMLVLVFLSAIFPAFLGLLLRADLLAPIAGALWILALVGGLVMTICLLALLFGWPLMWATIAAENTDYLDALSRSFAYTLQRPLAYLFYAVVAAFLGGLGWIVVYWFAEVLIWLTLWGASWGTGHERFQEILQQAPIETGIPLSLRDTDYRAALEPPAEISQSVVWGVEFIRLGNAVRTIAVAYLFSFLWSSAAGIYLLLRRDVDQKEIDEVYLEDEEEANTLPPLPTDVAGVAGAPLTESPEPEPPPPESGASQGSQPE